MSRRNIFKKKKTLKGMTDPALLNGSRLILTHLILVGTQTIDEHHISTRIAACGAHAAHASMCRGHYVSSCTSSYL